MSELIPFPSYDAIQRLIHDNEDEDPEDCIPAPFPPYCDNCFEDEGASRMATAMMFDTEGAHLICESSPDVDCVLYKGFGVYTDWPLAEDIHARGATNDGAIVEVSVKVIKQPRGEV